MYCTCAVETRFDQATITLELKFIKLKKGFLEMEVETRVSKDICKGELAPALLPEFEGFQGENIPRSSRALKMDFLKFEAAL